jgi:hypothetical protein
MRVSQRDPVYAGKQLHLQSCELNEAPLKQGVDGQVVVAVVVVIVVVEHLPHKPGQ